MSRRHVMLLALIPLTGGALLTGRQAPSQTSSPAPRPAVATTPGRAQVLDTMKRATAFMMEKVSTQGGFVWNYLPDMSRRWAEIEARPTMIWMQPPGTPTMGHLFVDAYYAAGDESYYRAAGQVAVALILAQDPAGGWNYVFDTAGEASLHE